MKHWADHQMLTFDIWANDSVSWNSNLSGYENDVDTFNATLNSTNSTFITNYKNNSYDDFTADKVVTGWNPFNRNI